MDDDEDLTNIPAELSHDTSRDDNTSDCIIKKNQRSRRCNECPTRIFSRAI